MAYINFQPKDHFTTKLYTGNGGNQTITGVGFQPDFAWFKSRDANNSHALVNSVLGTTKVLYTDTSGAETTISAQTFNGDGYALVQDAGANSINSNGSSKVAWNWKAGTTSGLSGGTITPSGYSFNATSGFSIIKYVGNSTQGATVPHGLGAAPKMIIIKSSSHGEQWVIGHNRINPTNSWDYYLHFTTGSAGQNNNRFGNVYPTSTLFTLGSEDQVNGNKTYIALCFAEKKGFSRIGSYIGNGNASGPMIYTGFKPAWTLIKESSDTGESWVIHDNKRSTGNMVNEILSPNSSYQEEGNHSTKGLDFYADGFKIRNTDGAFNTNGNTYIYMAFAQEPLVSSNDIPATAF